MRANKVTVTVAFIIFAAAVALTAVLPEEKYFHLPFQAAIIAVILLSLSFSVRDVIIISMLFSSVAWALGFFEIVSGVNTLLFETGIIIISAGAMGWYEVTIRNETEKQQTIIDYKKEQVEEINKNIAAIKKENDSILEEIKKSRKKFA